MSQIKVNSIVPAGGLPAGATGGGVIQTVYSTLTSQLSISYSGNNVDTGLSATINMQSASNKLLIICSPLWATNGNIGYLMLTDGSNNIIERPPANNSQGRYHWGTHYNGSASGDNRYHTARETFHCIISPGATGNYTVKLRAYVTNSGSHYVYLNRNWYNGDRINDPVGISTLTLQEISG
tara:strand:- start:10 stop:552 length:543 start_codon:yes stop_codon:yes gene_type:complete